MKPRVVVVAVLLAAIAWTAWRSQLWTVAQPGEELQPLRLRAAEARTPAAIDVTLPVVPVGVERLESGRGVLLVHYWAPWEQDSRSQAALLDSLRRLPEVAGLRVAIVCCDPFPSVARFVARQRLRLSVLMDGRSELRRVLPCPSVPYTYVLDGAGRLAVAQPGRVDWLSPETREVIESLLAEEMTRGPERPSGL